MIISSDLQWEENAMSAYEAVSAARALLQNLTPLKTDCGRLCQGACCQGDEQT